MARKDTPKQRRMELSKKMRERRIGRAIISNPKHIFYLTGFSTNLTWYGVLGKGQRSTSFLALRDDGDGSLLVGGSELRSPFVGPGDVPSIDGYDGEVVGYSDYDLDVTMVPYGSYLAPEMRAWLSRSVLGDRPSRVGIEDWHLAAIYSAAISKVSPESKLIGI